MPTGYLSIICCPACRAGLVVASASELRCLGCAREYPVIDGIPVLLDETEDDVSRTIKAFYDDGWKRSDAGVTEAKAAHEDLSDLGQRYVDENERRFERHFRAGGSAFLDAGPGAQPRERFGAAYDRHVCVDFSLDGLLECRRRLGERAVCVVGSLLMLPIRDGVIDGSLAAHSIYHIERDLQVQAIAELARVNEAGTTLIMYANPDALERRLARAVRRLRGRPTTEDPWRGDSFYFYAHPVDRMVAMIETAFGRGSVAAKPLRLFSVSISAPLFRVPLLGQVFFRLFLAIEGRLGRRMGWARYVGYVIRRGEAGERSQAHGTDRARLP